MDRAFRLATEGAPLAGHYSGSRPALTECNLYGHHKTVNDQKAAVWAKFAKKEALSYHIILPRFLWRFIFSLHLFP